MFRRKESDPPTPETTFPRGGEPRPAPELPRRAVEVPPPAVPERPAAVAATSAPAADDPEKKRLIVGNGISLAGEITACDRLVVQGSVQVTLNQTRAIEITESGRFTNGKAEVEEAEISGVYEGELTVKKRLLIRKTGEVKGTVRYGELEIERGGRLSGTVARIADGEPAGVRLAAPVEPAA